jgi:hypothetical protein
MRKRRRFKQVASLDERLEAEAKRLRDEAHTLAPGAERESLLRRAREMKMASRLDQWLTSPGLRPPN